MPVCRYLSACLSLFSSIPVCPTASYRFLSYYFTFLSSIVLHSTLCYSVPLLSISIFPDFSFLHPYQIYYFHLHSQSFLFSRSILGPMKRVFSQAPIRLSIPTLIHSHLLYVHTDYIIFFYTALLYSTLYHSILFHKTLYYSILHRITFIHSHSPYFHL